MQASGSRISQIVCRWALAVCLLVPAVAGWADEAALPAAPPEDSGSAVADARVLRLEKELQALPWPQFQAVIRAVPKLKAEVDAYGAFGWQYVKARYQRWPWRKNVGRLAPEQQQALGELIARAKSGRLPLAGKLD